MEIDHESDFEKAFGKGAFIEIDHESDFEKAFGKSEDVVDEMAASIREEIRLQIAAYPWWKRLLFRIRSPFLKLYMWLRRKK